MDLTGSSVFGLGTGEGCVPEERNLGEERFLVIFYRYATEDDEEPRNAITDEMVAKVRLCYRIPTHWSMYAVVCSADWTAARVAQTRLWGAGSED